MPNQKGASFASAALAHFWLSSRTQIRAEATHLAAESGGTAGVCASGGVPVSIRATAHHRGDLIRLAPPPEALSEVGGTHHRASCLTRRRVVTGQANDCAVKERIAPAPVGTSRSQAILTARRAPRRFEIVASPESLLIVAIRNHCG